MIGLWTNELRRSTELPEVAAALRAENLGRPVFSASCWDECSDFTCSRPDEHPGRHISAARNFVIAAWPGNHEPVVADLERPEVSA